MKRLPQRLVQLAPEFRRGASVIVVGGTQHNIASLSRASRVVTATSATINPGPLGMVGWKSDGTVAPFRNVGKQAYFEGPGGLTLMYVFSSTDTSAIQYVAGTLSTGANYVETLTLNRKADTTLGAGYLLMDLRADGIGNATFYSTSAATSYFDGSPHCVVAQWTVPTPASVAVGRMWVDGVEQTLTLGAAGAPGAHSQAAGLMEFDYYLNSRNARGTPATSVNGTIYLFGRWLTNAIDGRSLSENPQQIFASTDEDEDEWAFAVAAAGFQPAWAHRRSRSIGAGVI